MKSCFDIASLPCTFFFCSLLIYTLAKERSRDDGESYESWLAAVINNILVDTSIRGLIVGSQILNAFGKKISTSYSALKRAKSGGGKSVRMLMNKWELGPKYSFTVFL